MPVTIRGQKVIAGVLAAWDRKQHERLVEAVERCCQLRTRSGDQLTQIELSLALDAYAPPLGKSGAAMVTRWMSGTRKPKPADLIALEQIADGVLRLHFTGMDGPRHLYEITTAPCPHCDFGMRRRDGVEQCDRCGHQEPGRDDPDMLVYDPLRPPEQDEDEPEIPPDDLEIYAQYLK